MTTILILTLLGSLFLLVLLVKFSGFLLKLVSKIISNIIMLVIFMVIIATILFARLSSDTGLQKIELFSKNNKETIIPLANLQNVHCTKGSRYFFSFGTKIKKNTVNIKNESNTQNVTMTLKYHPSGNIQKIIFQTGKSITVKGSSSYDDTGFHLIVTNDCTISAKLK